MISKRKEDRKKTKENKVLTQPETHLNSLTRAEKSFFLNISSVSMLY